jgi:hypothetical protein
MRFSRKTSPLAENGHQSAEFRQGVAKGASSQRKIIPPNPLTCQQINYLNHF